MADTERMRCPACGAEMNHHADKVVHATVDAGADGDVVDEVHACPRCGMGAVRRREAT